MYSIRKRRRVRREEKVLEFSKSNPSQRHRHRLNKELDQLANLLPFDTLMLSRLDKLSILRLAVTFIGMKNHFSVTATFREENFDLNIFESKENSFQILNGFFILVSLDCKLFYVSDNVDKFLGFQQSDVLQQDVRDLIHSADHQLFAKNLLTSHSLNGDSSSFIVRFRCTQPTATNISVFQAFEICGRVFHLGAWTSFAHSHPSLTKTLSSIKNKISLTSMASTSLYIPAFFGFCFPVGPSPLLDRRLHANSFKSKHQMDTRLISIDLRLSNIIFSTDENFISSSFFSKVHPLDLSYFVAKYRSLIKMGNGFLSAYRLLLPSDRGEFVWVQTNCKVSNRSNKLSTLAFAHHLLLEIDGEKLMQRRDVTDANRNYHIRTFPAKQPKPTKSRNQVYKVRTCDDRSKSQDECADKVLLDINNNSTPVVYTNCDQYSCTTPRYFSKNFSPLQENYIYVVEDAVPQSAVQLTYASNAPVVMPPSLFASNYSEYAEVQQNNAIGGKNREGLSLNIKNQTACPLYNRFYENQHASILDLVPASYSPERFSPYDDAPPTYYTNPPEFLDYHEKNENTVIQRNPNVLLPDYLNPPDCEPQFLDLNSQQDLQNYYYCNYIMQPMHV